MIIQRLKSIALFLVACVTNPCCTPLIVPLALAALAGTPLAAWVAFHLGWVYGGLTLISVASLVFAVRQINWPAARGSTKKETLNANKPITQ